jgi:hypothetical protein
MSSYSLAVYIQFNLKFKRELDRVGFTGWNEYDGLRFRSRWKLSPICSDSAVWGPEKQRHKQEWASYCRYVTTIENPVGEKDAIMEDVIDENYVIHMGNTGNNAPNPAWSCALRRTLATAIASREGQRRGGNTLRLK